MQFQNSAFAFVALLAAQVAASPIIEKRDGEAALAGGDDGDCVGLLGTCRFSGDCCKAAVDLGCVLGLCVSIPEVLSDCDTDLLTRSHDRLPCKWASSLVGITFM